MQITHILLLGVLLIDANVILQAGIREVIVKYNKNTAFREKLDGGK